MLCLARGKYQGELMTNAGYTRSHCNGILSASVDSIDKRELIRRSFHEHHISAPGTLQYLNGVFLFEESFCLKTIAGKPILDVLKKVISASGIKVNEGTNAHGEFNGIIITDQDLPFLAERCGKYYSAGFRVAKLFTTLKIVSPDEPSIHDIDVTAETLAKYAKICQENGLIPLLDIDIVGDGQADMERCGDVTKNFLVSCFKSLINKRVLLEGTFLKPNIVIPNENVAPAEMAKHTFRALWLTMPPAVAGVVVSDGPLFHEMIKCGKGTPFNFVSMKNMV